MMKKVLNRQAIIRMLQLHKEQTGKFGVRKIGLFGSFAKGKQKSKSDLDFLVVFDEPNFDKYMELKFFLEKLFHRKVDLVIEENLKSALKHVKREAIYV